MAQIEKPDRPARREREHRADGVFEVVYEATEERRLTTESLVLECVREVLKRERERIFATPGEHEDPDVAIAGAVVSTLYARDLLRSDAGGGANV